MAAELEHPRFGCGRRAQERDVVEITSKHRAALWTAGTARATRGSARSRLRWRTARARRRRASAARAALRSVVLEIVVRLPDLLHLLKSLRTQYSCKHSHRGCLLLRSHFFQADTAARHKTCRKVRPAGALRLVTE